jgi:predicted aconitase
MPTSLYLTPSDQALLAGEGGDAAAMAMRIVVGMAQAVGAERLMDITAAHIDGCLHHGPVGLDFVERLVEGGGQVVVPTTLNVSSLDLLHPELYRGDAVAAEDSRRQMGAYEALGCRPTWTCAPYQLAGRPSFGQQIAWGESNAIAFANSVLGARTNRYGDFIDIAAALTGRVPAAGLHLDAGRLATLVVDVAGAGISGIDFALLGHIIGQVAGSRVVLVDGIDDAGEDDLKALGAAAASTGSVGLVHVAGITPEAIDERPIAADAEHVAIDRSRLRAARDELDTVTGDRLDAVSVGTPHASAAEIRRLASLVGDTPVADGITAYVSTARDTLPVVGAEIAALVHAGWQVVTDTCTYITPIITDARVVMTDSAKWAFYAPGNIGVDVVIGSMEECVASAAAGLVIRDV